MNGSKSPCQSQFGSNAQPLGGSLGVVTSARGAVEFQKQTFKTPILDLLIKIYKKHRIKLSILFVDQENTGVLKITIKT